MGNGEEGLEIGSYRLKGFPFEYLVWFTLNSITLCAYQAVASIIFTLIAFFGGIL